MDSVDDHPDGWGFPIRKSSDQSVLATPRSLSQPATSFIASQCQGIRQTPLLCLISRFVSEKDNLAIVVFGSFRAGDDPHNKTALIYPFLHPAFERCRARNFLDFQTSSDKRCQRTNRAPFQARVFLVDGGGRRDRTDDLLLAKQALSQLSYAPV